MKKLIAAFALALLPVVGFASEAGVELEKANIDLHNQAAIQRGAKYFTNYCMGCHSAKYVRYQLLKNVGLSESQIKDNLIFDGSKVGDLMSIAMPEAYAAGSFGAPAPDLTLEARRRSADWIYTYLKSFYTDPSRPTGVNNIVFPNVGMPNILWELEGIKDPVFKYEVHEGTHSVGSYDTEAEAEAAAKEMGEGHRVVKIVHGFERRTDGKLSDADFDQAVRDLTTYLTYIAEPMKLERQEMGVWVLLFLVVFTVLAYMMKKEWWKDVH
jgi:ubiquinol-cytochrome c reductase cytochrome c1 subunit